MRSSAKHGVAENNRGISGHVLTRHQRLYHALNLGCRSWETREKWHCSDTEIQKLVIRSIDGFLDCISSETLQHPLVKDSVVDMVKALESILEFKSQSILTLASNVAVKMVNILPSSMLQSHVLDLICPLANLLSSQQLQVAMSCATALHSIISKLSFRRDREVLQILKETKAVGYLVHNINGFCVGDKPIEYFQAMASVLSKILWRWPPFRFCVWNDSKFLNVLDAVKLMSENSAKVAVLQLYSTLALCRNGAEKLLDNGEALLQMMVGCMDCSNNLSVRMEAFNLAQCLALSRRGCMKMMSICCEPLVKAVISAINNGNSLSEKLAKSQMPIVKEACCLASITRWAGDHHKYFWEAGVDRLLLDLLLDSYHKIHQLPLELSVNDLLIIVQESLNANFKRSLRPYVWDILGGLAANCAENLNHERHGKERQLNVLIMCTCLAFIDSIGISRHISENNLPNMTEGESAARAVVMMVYSPCKYIASMARSILCKILKSNGKDYLEYFLKTLKARVSGIGIPGNLQIVVSLMSLACHSSLPQYRKHIIKCEGIETLVDFIRWWLKNPVYIKRASMVPHLHNFFRERICCFPGTEEWEGEDILLLFSLLILAEILPHTASKKIHPSVNQADYAEDQLVRELQEVCSDSTSPGSRWYAAYILCYFGLYGFPSKLGNRIGKALGENEHADLKLNLVNQESVYVHEVILMVRCPLLLPPRESVLEEKSSSGSTVKQDLQRNTIKSVRLSAHVDQQSLLKLLEFVYLGYLQASDDLVKKLKIFAKHCKLEALLQMLCQTIPRWGTPMPSFDLSPALEPAGHHNSNILMEANTTQLVHWKCNSCSASVPHLHVHKVILESSCDYLRALFQSGMRESHLQTINVPVSWESLNKLVSWFYSDQLPVPNFDCSWNNLDPEVIFQEVQPYLELCWLAEFWLIGDLYEECYKVVVSCLNSSTQLPSKIIQIAADFSQWKLAQVAAKCMAPSYQHLRNSGELDALDNNLVEMVRAASVQLSQEGSHNYS